MPWADKIDHRRLHIGRVRLEILAEIYPFTKLYLYAYASILGGMFTAAERSQILCFLHRENTPLSTEIWTMPRLYVKLILINAEVYLP